MPTLAPASVSGGINRAIAGIPAIARHTPATPPSSATRKLSVRIWRTIRPRLAPMAMRSAISLARTAPRIRNRFATFAQATRSTKIAAPSSTSIAGRTSPENASRSGCRLTPNWSLASGYARARPAAMVSISARACSIRTPAASRPTTSRSPRSPLSVALSLCVAHTPIGSITSHFSTQRKSGGSTPTIVTVWLSRRIVCPIALRSAPKCDCQSA